MRRNLPYISIPAETRRSATLTLLWGLAIAAINLQALLQKTEPSDIDLILIGGVCLLAGAAMGDFSHGLIGFMIATTIGMAISFLLPVLAFDQWQLNATNNIVLNSLWLTVVFQSIFPFPFLVYLVSSITGAAIGERYLN